MREVRQQVADTVTGFFHELGAEIAHYSAEKVVIRLALEQRHLNNASTLHGGVLATLADVAMAMAGTYVNDPHERRVAITLSMNLSFEGVAKAGSTVLATGYCTTAGHKIFMSRCEIKDSMGTLLAFATGVFKRGALRRELP